MKDFYFNYTITVSGGSKLNYDFLKQQETRSLAKWDKLRQ